MDSLPIFLRLSGRPVILLGQGETADAKRRLLERAGAVVCGEEDTASIAIVAIEDEAGARAAVGRLRARSILVNAADRPALCDFTLPAIVDRDPVLIAIGTGGASAGLAKALRQRLEAMLPQDLGRLATALRAVRPRMRSRWPDAAERRHAIDEALSSGGILDPLADRADQGVDRWLDRDTAQPSGALEHVLIRSPDPDELTLRQARLLARADHVSHRRDIPAAILDRARADAVRISSQRAPSAPEEKAGLWVDVDWER